MTSYDEYIIIVTSGNPSESDIELINHNMLF